MTEIQILRNQIETDEEELEKDAEVGVDIHTLVGELNRVGAKKARLWKLQENSRCPECGEIREDDERVGAGMKCGRCAYGL